MKKWTDFFNKYKTKVNKYQFTILVFLGVTFFIGDNTLLDGIHYTKRINDLQKEVETLKKANENTLQRLNALQSDEESLEKFAREQFLMTKSDEELFLIVE
jgi:cell division protein FtsB